MTSTTPLSEENIHDVQTRLWIVRSWWMEIGLALNFSPSTLRVIKKNNQCENDMAFISMLYEWLTRAEPIPCWKSLAIALKSPSVGIQEGK